MSSHLKKWRPVGMIAGIAATVITLGCGGDDSGLERRYKVSGRVTYKGEPVTKGTIAFEPADAKGRIATGYIEDGSYSLTTSIPGDGALPGDYKVGIAASNLDLSELAKKTPGGMVHHGDPEHQAAIKGAKSTIPTKYAQAQNSGLTAKVEARSNPIDFDLKD